MGLLVPKKKDFKMFLPYMGMTKIIYIILIISMNKNFVELGSPIWHAMFPMTYTVLKNKLFKGFNHIRA